MYGLGVNRLGATRSLLGDAIANLFSNGEQGVWYDPSSINTLYQDSQGVTPVTAVGEPVGLMLDKSKGLKAIEKVSDTEFDNPSAWDLEPSLAISNGELVLSSSGTSGGAGAFTAGATVVGRSYKISFEVTAISGSTIHVAMCDSKGGDNQQAITPSINSVGKHSFIITATGQPTAGARLRLAKGSGRTATVINFSMQEIQGSHATQPTSTKRPIYARHPEGGIRNLLSYTQEFDDDYWSKSASVIANQATAPDGTTTADEITFPVQYSNVRSPDLITTAGVTATVSVWLKNVDGNTVLRLRGNTSGGTYLQSINITNEWARYTATFTHDGTNDIKFALQDGNASNLGSVLIWGAQLEVGSTATQYQHVTDDSRYDITEPFGANSLNYLKFDGVSDGMSLTGLTSTSTPITAWFGYSATNANSGAFKYLLDIETGRTILAASTDTAGTIGYNAPPWRKFEADSNALKVLTYDLVEDNAKMRVDGTQEYSDTTYDQRAIGGDIGLFQNHFFAGAFVAGNLYSCILRAAESTDKEIASTESYVAKKTGISL